MAIFKRFTIEMNAILKAEEDLRTEINSLKDMIQGMRLSFDLDDHVTTYTEMWECFVNAQKIIGAVARCSDEVVELFSSRVLSNAVAGCFVCAAMHCRSILADMHVLESLANDVSLRLKDVDDASAQELIAHLGKCDFGCFHSYIRSRLIYAAEFEILLEMDSLQGLVYHIPTEFL